MPRTASEAFAAGGLAEFLPRRLADLPQVLSETREAPRVQLVAALDKYLARIGAPEPSRRAARRLAHPGSRAILTGQQAGLLTGPAFTFYKAHTALRLAEEHDQPEAPVVPVFWIASQDHDVAEVATAHWLESDQVVSLSLDLPAGVPVGRIPFAPYFERVQSALMGKDFVPSQLDLVLEALAGDFNMAEVFARLLLAYLGPRGLVVADPLSPELAPLFAPSLERELQNPLASSQAINYQAQLLRSRGIQTGLGRAAGATNLFLEGEDGQRRNLHFHNGVFSDGVQSYSQRELSNILHQDPSRMTPGAGIRPILQDTVFPTAGFVVGPGELAYVAELGGVYELHNLPKPAVIERLHALVIEPTVGRILERYGLDAWEFVSDPGTLFRQAIGRESTEVQAIKNHLDHIVTELAEVAAYVRDSDSTLLGSVRRFDKRTNYEFGRLATKLVESQLRRDASHRFRKERLERHLLPLGHNQERVLAFIGYSLKYGVEVIRGLESLPAVGMELISL